MSDSFEIDFLDVESEKSGDAIAMRYCVSGNTRIHITDGGFQSTGEKLVSHIDKYYGKPSFIDLVVVTHPDGDHAGGLRELFSNYRIGEIWMLRPWLYANELLDRFKTFSSARHLVRRLRNDYPNIAALEDLAIQNGTTIKEPLQGSKIGDFFVLAPSRNRYLDLVVESEKTPESAIVAQTSLMESAGVAIRSMASFIAGAWGVEYFPDGDTSPENNMSVIQYARICEKRILLTGDAGRAAMNEAADFAESQGVRLPGIDHIQVPHHGSRHNVSVDVLDRWLGKKRVQAPSTGEFTAIVSASKKDKDHPRKAVVRAFIHRGANVFTTEGNDFCISSNAPMREGWVGAQCLSYPFEQEQ